MAKGFCPMLICVKGETADSDFLPKGNYVDINGKKTPLRHCFTLELPVGECELLICSPPPNTIHRVCTVVRENQMFRLVLTVDCARNIIDAGFGMEDVTEDPFGLYEIECRHAVENREEIRRWQI